MSPDPFSCPRKALVVLIVRAAPYTILTGIRDEQTRGEIHEAMELGEELHIGHACHYLRGHQCRRLWAQFLNDVNPAGICLDPTGGIWVAGSGPCALHVSEGGEIDHRITTKRPVFDTVLGGAELKHLFMCTSASNDPVIPRQFANATIDVAEVTTIDVKS